MATVLGAFSPQVPQNQHEAARGQAQQADRQQRVQDELGDGFERVARAIEEASPRPTSADEKKEAKDDVQAQRDMARWAGVLGWLTGVQVLIGVVGTAALIVTLNHGQMALDRQRISQRAWVTTTDVHRGLNHHDGQLYIQCAALWKNVGQTPANRVRISVDSNDGDFPEDAAFTVLGPSSVGGAPLKSIELGALWRDRNKVTFTSKIEYLDIFEPDTKRESKVEIAVRYIGNTDPYVLAAQKDGPAALMSGVMIEILSQSAT